MLFQRLKGISHPKVDNHQRLQIYATPPCVPGKPWAIEGCMKDGEDTGRYKIRRRLPKKDFAYVTGTGSSTYMDQSEYRAKGCLPSFKSLPWKEEYNIKTRAKLSACLFKP